MKRSPLIGIAHNALHDRDRGFAEYLINQVNLTLLEKEIIMRSEINGEKIEMIANTLNHWENPGSIKTVCSYPNCNRIKRIGMVKIGEYLQKTIFLQ